MKKHHRNSPFGSLFLYMGAILILASIFYAVLFFQHVPAAPEPTPTPTHIPTTTNNLYATGNPYLACPPHSPCFLMPTVHSTPTIAYRAVAWKELVRFIEDDHTNWNKYDPDYYVCLDFSTTLVENARKQNIKAWVVLVDYYNEEFGHAFVAFETTDLGIVFIEPQGDNRYLGVEKGKPLCDSWGLYKCMGTIKSIEYDQCDHSRRCTKYTP